MGKNTKNKKKVKGAEKTAMKTEKKLQAKQMKMLEKLGEAKISDIIASLEKQERSLTTISETVSSPPSPRSSFSLVAHPEKEELILFGGEFFNGQKTLVFNDLFFYNIAKNEWRLLRSPAGPTPRCAHQMASVSIDGGQLWLFGGEHASPSQVQFYHYKDLWLMSLKTKRWEKIEAAGGPSARSGHRMVAAKRKLFVFGGFHDNNHSYQYFNDMHIFSIDNRTWLNVDVTSTLMPQPRSACCMSANSDGNILVWGGYSKSRLKKDVDIGVVHTDMFSFIPDKTSPNSKFKWVAIKPSGYKPEPRSSVGFASANNGRIYCFGGVMDVEEDEEDVVGQFGDSLTIFDLATHSWRLHEAPAKKKPKQKSNDASSNESEMLEDNNETVVSTDGVFTMTVAAASSSTVPAASSTKSFTEITGGKQIPSARMKAGMCVCKGVLYLFGGCYEAEDKQFTLNDFYALDLHKMDQWKVLIPNTADAHEWIDSDNSDSEDNSSMTCDSESDDDSDSSEMQTD